MELLKIAPVKEEQSSQLLFTLRLQRLSFPEDSTSPTAASGHLVKNLPGMKETLVQFLGQEVPLEEG